MNIEKAMFHLIQFEVFQYELHNNIRCGISRLVSSKAYCGLYTLSKKHNVSNVVASALSKLGLLGEDEVSKCFRKQLMVSVYYYEQTEYDLEIITQILDDAKIPYIPLKGSVMRKYYPEAWMRTCCDIDILIKKENTEKAIKFLKESLEIDDTCKKCKYFALCRSGGCKRTREDRNYCESYKAFFDACLPLFRAFIAEKK